MRLVLSLRLLRLLLPFGVLPGVLFADQIPQGSAGRGAFTPPAGSAIVGTVRADDGRPLEGLSVRVLARGTLMPGDSSFYYIPRTSTRTNARGEYRLDQPPGQYIVDVPLTHVTMPSAIVAAARGTAGNEIRQRVIDSLGPTILAAGAPVGDFSLLTLGDQGPVPLPRAPSANEVRVYASTIFPNARNTRDAQVIAIGIGETFRADIIVPSVRGLRVSGALTGPPSDVAHMSVRLLPQLDDVELIREGDFEQAVTVTNERGEFTLLGVPSGSYTLRALYVPSFLPGAAGTGRGAPARVGARGGGSPTEAAMPLVRWAEASGNVGAGDVVGLKVSVRPPVRVSGTIRVAQPSAATIDFGQSQIMLLSNRPVTIAPPAPFSVGGDGRFTVQLYGPGLYRAQVSGVPGFSVATIGIGAAEPSPRWLSVPRDDLTGVTVTLSSLPAPGRSAPPPSGPPPPPNPDNAYLAGRVIDGTTNAPIPDATVVLQRANDAGAPRRSTTDASGAFVFGDAIAGSYSVTATAAGYSAGGFGRMRPEGPASSLGLAARERVSTMTIRMWKPGSIAGGVVDTSGRAIRGLPLVALRVTDVGTRRDYTIHSLQRTTSTGTYRFANLPPGGYVVCASFTPTTIPETLHQMYLKEQGPGRGGSGMAAILAQSRAPTPTAGSVLIGAHRFRMGGPDAGIVPVPVAVSSTSDIRSFASRCFPSADGIADATIIAVRPGHEQDSTNFELASVPTVRVSGTLRGPSGPMPHVGVRLVRVTARSDYIIGSERLEAASTVSDAQGAFSFLGVPPGSYLLRTWTTHVEGEPPPAAPAVGRPLARPSGVTLWAEMPVTVADSNLSNVHVVLRSTARVRGRVVFDGVAERPMSLPLSLWTRQQFDPPLPLSTTVKPDGTFLLAGYAPGRYSLPSASVGSWRITAAALNGKTLPGHAIDLTTDDMSELVLIATDKFTTLTGRVVAGGGLGPIEAMICIFPADYKAWFAEDMTPTRSRTFRPSGTYTYSASWLPPGDYLAVVYREAEGADFTPAFVERLARFATPITLRPGERTLLDLAVVAIR